MARGPANGPVCPRCRYDLQGETTRWSDACPLRGRCPECGYELAWAEIFVSARFAHLRWLYDLTPHRCLGVRRAWLTALRALLPWSFWRRVNTSIPVSVPRLVLWPVIMLLPFYALFIACNMWFTHSVHGEWVPRPWAWRLELFAPFLFDAGETAPSGQTAPLWFPNRQALGVALGGVTPALMLLLLPASRAAAGIRPSHLARAAMYAQLPLVSVIFWHAFTMLVALNGELQTGIPIGRSFYTWRGRIAVVEGYAIVAWLLLWWYFAVARGLRPQAPRVLGAAAALVALLTVAICVLGYWRFWYFTLGAP